MGRRGGLGGVNSVVPAHVASDSGLKHGNHLDLIQPLVLKARAGPPLYPAQSSRSTHGSPINGSPGSVLASPLPSSRPASDTCSHTSMAAWEAMENLSEEVACELRSKQ